MTDPTPTTRGWRPIASAPKDGTAITARRSPKDVGCRGRKTWWGKASHVPLYGWCIGTDMEDIDLWRPDEWKPRA
jgi:hypothetical protein